MSKVIIIGAGAAGLSAAIELAQNGIASVIISEMPSERAQSVMAEGGINGALDTMKEGDSPRLHMEETLKAGRFLADPLAVKNLTEAAPKILAELDEMGMSLNKNADGTLALRSFGGQSRKRTAFASVDTGKQLMTALIAKSRRYEAEGLIERRTGLRFLKLIKDEEGVKGCITVNADTHKKETFVSSQLIMACGGLNGLFGNATGSVLNTGDVQAELFLEGVRFANLEFIQYHPTTVRLHGKNMLISEAARGEGGRLYVVKDGKPYYFMEEKYPELGNLMPRDVVSGEEYRLMKEGYQIYLNLRSIGGEVFRNRLSGISDKCRKFLSLDPEKEPIPVEPGIHYFMGGIYTDPSHRTNVKGLYAAGECACQYHGANRLGGNSLLGALFGGRQAAKSAMEDMGSLRLTESFKISETEEFHQCPEFQRRKIAEIMRESLGIERDGESLKAGIAGLDELIEKDEGQLYALAVFSKAVIESALLRKESRGAHVRSDYPTEEDSYKVTTIAEFAARNPVISYAKIQEAEHADQDNASEIS